MQKMAATTPTYTIRTHCAADIAQVLSHHKRQFVEEWGWNTYFMEVITSILNNYTTSHDPAKERFWIAERSSTGEFLGCVMLVRKHPPGAKRGKDIEIRGGSDGVEQGRVARLRMLFVAPAARGMGLGRVLVRKTTEFAREVGYDKVQLTTSTYLGPANRIYKEEGYVLLSEEVNDVFGPSLLHTVLELAVSRPQIMKRDGLLSIVREREVKEIGGFEA